MITTTNLTTMRTVGRYGSAIDLIAIHTMEAPEGPQTAENVANYFKKVKASAHWCVDADSRVRVVLDQDMSWALPGAQARSLNIELAGYARQTAADWADPYSHALLEIAAYCAAEWVIKYNIPIRHLTDAEIRSGAKGFVGHVDVNRVYKKSTHWDPGPNFPWSFFLSRVQAKVYEIRGGVVAPPVPTPSPSAPPVKVRPNCVALQKAVRALPDNDWGPVTDKHFDALRAASIRGGQRFPYGILFAQLVVGAVQDAYWGPKSAAAHTATVKNVQTALRSMGYYNGMLDGVWGDMTERSYQSARTACHR